MNTHTPKESPVASESLGASLSQQQYFTADEAIAFLEPRIRAMFR